MKKILKINKNLEGCTVYRERSDCSYWTLGKYDGLHDEYEAKNEDTGEIDRLKPCDLIGDYLV